MPNYDALGSHLNEETKQMIRDLAAKEKKEMQDAGEWDYNDPIGSITRCYTHVLDNLLTAIELDKDLKEEKDENS